MDKYAIAMEFMIHYNMILQEHREEIPKSGYWFKMTWSSL